MKIHTCSKKKGSTHFSIADLFEESVDVFQPVLSEVRTSIVFQPSGMTSLHVRDKLTKRRSSGDQANQQPAVEEQSFLEVDQSCCDESSLLDQSSCTFNEQLQVWLFKLHSWNTSNYFAIDRCLLMTHLSWTNPLFH